MATNVNIADLFTKSLTEARTLELLRLMSLEFHDGRATTAPKLIKSNS